MTNPFIFRGQVASKDQLPTAAAAGDVYAVKADNQTYVYIDDTDTVTWRIITHIDDTVTTYGTSRYYHRGDFRTHCKCCGSLMPYTESELNTCEHCGVTQNTYEKE